MNAKRHIAYLCGCFSVRNSYTDPCVVDPRWERIYQEREVYETYLKFYYPEFVEFSLQTSASAAGRSVSRYSMPINQNFSMSLFGRKDYQLTIGSVSLYIMPCNLLIYAIRVEQDGASMDDITAALAILRNVNGYASATIGEPFMYVLRLLDKLYDECMDADLPLPEKKPGSYTHLIENGNKLKIFQIAELNESIRQKEQNELLFETGTLAPIGSYAVQNAQSSSPEYFNTIMEKNKISIFNGWKGLALLDTFTIIGYDVPPFLWKNWQADYFEMIYMHSIFLKFYLYRTNLFFRKKVCKLSKLMEEFVEFERSYYFNKISYNFLPLEIRKALDSGLEINEEKEQLYHLIEQENEVQEKRSDRKMNNLLFFLTCLTIFSTVWDTSCLFDRLYPYETVIGSSILGYRFVVSAFFALILLVILFNRRMKR